MSNILPLEIKIGSTFGPIELRAKDSAGVAVPLAGWTAHAQIRLSDSSPLILDLSPTIEADDAEGLVTIPAVPWEITATLAAGVFRWDLILEDPDGNRLTPPLANGPVTVGRTITKLA